MNNINLDEEDMVSILSAVEFFTVAVAKEMREENPLPEGITGITDSLRRVRAKIIALLSVNEAKH